MNTQPSRDMFNQMLRKDFRFFVWRVFQTLNPGVELRWNWHLAALCHVVETMATTPGDRLAIAVGPRHLKSIIVSVAFIAWMLGRNPALKFMVASYNIQFAGDLADQFIKVIESPWYRSAFPDFKVARKADGEIKTTKGGGRRPVSVGGATTGFGADYIIVDDLTKAQAADMPGERQTGVDYFRTALVTRLNDAETGRIAIVGQRLHDEDVIGYCLETGIYRYLCLPAIAPGPAEIPLGRGKVKRVKTGDLLFYPMETLERLRKEMGERAFKAQLLQDTAGSETLFVKWHRIPRYAEMPPREAFLVVAQSWDTAQADNAGADWSVCTTWGFREGKWWLLHLWRFQADFVDVKARVLAMQAEWRADHVIIEDVASGSGLLSLLRSERRESRVRDHGWELHGYQPKVHKTVRWQAQATRLEAGNVLFPEQAPWLEVLRREISSFPGRNDDQVDSISQFLAWSHLRTGTSLMREFNGRPLRDDSPRPNPGPRPDPGPRRNPGPRRP